MGIIAIVGRPNVGKSSLFNRLLGRREAIVDDFPGVTRDRLYGEIVRDGRRHYIVDTGGIMGDVRDPFPDIVSKTEKQVAHALDECDCAIFVLDAMEGVTVMDEQIASLLRRSGKSVVVAVNKTDDPRREESSWDASALGFDVVLPVSASHSYNIGELLDAVEALLPEDGTGFEEDSRVPVAIVGRPNVGKSSLLNALAREERSLVSDIPGTTRDVVDTTVELDGTTYRFLDTAGIRRKSRVRDDIEFYSTVRAYRAIDQCRVALVLLDASELVTDQDKRLIGAVLERGKGLVIVVNKWDLMPNDEKVGDRTRKLLRDELPFAAHAPRVFISAQTRRGVARIAQHIKKADEARSRRVSTSELNRLTREVLVFERMPTDGRGRALRIKYCTQASGSPPAFVFFVNDRRLVTRPFERRLENILRGLADFEGSPIRLFFRDGDERSEQNAKKA